MGRKDHPIALGHARAKAPTGIAPKLFYGLIGTLMLTNMVMLVGVLMAPDIARLFNNRADRIEAAYEDRIVQLRLEVDRLHSRQYAQAGDLNLQMQELVQQQETLAEQHQYVRALASKAAELGIVTADAQTKDIAPSLLTGAIRGVSPSGNNDLDAVRDSMNAMMGDTRAALATLSDATTSSTNMILDGLGKVGLRPNISSIDDNVAMGGPLISEDPSPDNELLDDANSVVSALAEFQLVKGALAAAPVHQPLKNYTRISSNFGSRVDPFTHKKAYHSGMDFPSPRGTSVFSAGQGKVTFAGVSSGYGNMVEIEHQGGFKTRYGHMSAILVRVGESVNTGSIIGKVGSTGRSTGPHLHFEVRRNNTAINPADFLAAGHKLQRFL